MFKVTMIWSDMCYVLTIPHDGKVYEIYSDHIWVCGPYTKYFNSLRECMVWLGDPVIPGRSHAFDDYMGCLATIEFGTQTYTFRNSEKYSPRCFEELGTCWFPFGIPQPSDDSPYGFESSPIRTAHLL
jgi:hypothetical protein